MNKVFGNPNRGPLAEWVIRYILNKWKKDKRILDFDQSASLDARGKDFLVTLRGGLEVPVQIKSSRSDIRSHHKHYPNVKFLFVVSEFPTNEKDYAVISRVEKSFRSEFNDFVEIAVGPLVAGGDIRYVRLVAIP